MENGVISVSQITENGITIKTGDNIFIIVNSSYIIKRHVSVLSNHGYIYINDPKNIHYTSGHIGKILFTNYDDAVNKLLKVRFTKINILQYHFINGESMYVIDDDGNISQRSVITYTPYYTVCLFNSSTLQKENYTYGDIGNTIFFTEEGAKEYLLYKIHEDIKKVKETSFVFVVHDSKIFTCNIVKLYDTHFKVSSPDSSIDNHIINKADHGSIWFCSYYFANKYLKRKLNDESGGNEKAMIDGYIDDNGTTARTAFPKNVDAKQTTFRLADECKGNKYDSVNAIFGKAINDMINKDDVNLSGLSKEMQIEYIENSVCTVVADLMFNGYYNGKPEKLADIIESIKKHLNQIKESVYNTR